MIAIPGIYDGKAIKALEPIHARAHARVIITFLDDDRSANVPATRLEDVAGCLAWTGPAKTMRDMEEAIRRGARDRRI